MGAPARHRCMRTRAHDADIISLDAADGEEIYGGKSVNLGMMLRAGLPVPEGWALSADFAANLASGSASAVRHLLDFASANLHGLVAVRSSAIGEDSQAASFAGQHATFLGIKDGHGLVSAVLRVVKSGEWDSAMAYRRASGTDQRPRVAVTIQNLVDPISAGVLFTRNPVGGADERIVEAAWGLGEAVVSSRVEPDRLRFSREGRLIELLPGQKAISLHPLPDGDVTERRLPPEEAAAPSIQPSDIAGLNALAAACERVFGPDQDIEWAKDTSRIWLLQSRPITRVQAARKAMGA